MINRYLTVILAISVFALTIEPAAAQSAIHRPGQWQLPDRGRNQGVVGGPGMPKCNPHVSDECRRLYPSLLKKVPPPNGAQR
jgi:hypothetical protein